MPITSTHTSNEHILYVALPFAIVRNAVKPMQTPEAWACPVREELHQVCAQKMSAFDRLTIVPVNIELHSRKVPLTREAFRAIREDIEHTSSMSRQDPVHKRIMDFERQSHSQQKIASAFSASGEKVGSFFHSILGVGFTAKAEVMKTAVHAQPEGLVDHHKIVTPH